MVDQVMRKFEDALDKMIEACQRDASCKNLLVAKVLSKQTKTATQDMEDMIDSYKTTFEYDEDNQDVQDFRSIQDHLKQGNITALKNKYSMMDTLPREWVPETVDMWIKTAKTIHKSI
jgi:hypothetical protein